MVPASAKRNYANHVGYTVGEDVSRVDGMRLHRLELANHFFGLFHNQIRQPGLPEPEVPQGLQSKDSVFLPQRPVVVEKSCKNKLVLGESEASCAPDR